MVASGRRGRAVGDWFGDRRYAARSRAQAAGKPVRSGVVATMNDSAEIQRLAGEMLQEVLRRTHLSSAPDLATVVAEEGQTIGADPLVLYVVDHEQQRLTPVPGPGAEGREVLSVQGTVAGRAFAAASIVELEREGGGRRVWLPLLDGTERLGVAEMTFAEHEEPLPEPLPALGEAHPHFLRSPIG